MKCAPEHTLIKHIEVKFFYFQVEASCEHAITFSPVFLWRVTCVTTVEPQLSGLNGTAVTCNSLDNRKYEY